MTDWCITAESERANKKERPTKGAKDKKGGRFLTASEIITQNLPTKHKESERAIKEKAILGHNLN